MKYTTIKTASRSSLITLIVFIGLLLPSGIAKGAPLRAGISKVNITNTEAGGLIRDSMYVRALALDNGRTQSFIISVDILWIDNILLDKVRSQLQQELNINPATVLVNAMHLHSTRPERTDIDRFIVKAVKEAWKNRVPVNVGVGTGYEDRIQQNKRLKLKNGKEWEIRLANALPPDQEVAGVTPVDAEIGILRLDRKNGKNLAVVYNFACHPTFELWKRFEVDMTGWEKVPTSADYPGYACKVIENNLDEGAIALFIQGFGGDIISATYKDNNTLKDAEPWGNMLGLSTLQALENIECQNTGELKVVNRIIRLPRRTDLPQRIESLKAEQEKLLESLRTTSLELKTFIPLYIMHFISPEYPSGGNHLYLHDKMMGRSNWEDLDYENKIKLDKYVQNIYAMEKLARIRENMYHLKRQMAIKEAAGEETIDVEIMGMKIGDFVIVTFPAEVHSGVGLSIKKMSPHEFTFTAGYTNGYINYAPTTEQFKGEDYSDINCQLAPEWQKIYEKEVMEILREL